MARYLLPAQTLLSLCADNDNGARRWFANEDPSQMRVSVISIAKARDSINQQLWPTLRDRLNLALNHLLEQIAADADAGAALAFESGHASAWQTLISEPTLTSLGVTDKQIYGTAMHDDLVVAEETGPHIAAVRALGIKVVIF